VETDYTLNVTEVRRTAEDVHAEIGCCEPLHCSCAEGFVSGPCAVCEGWYLSSELHFFRLSATLSGNISEWTWEMCPRCARLSLEEIQTIASSHLESAECDYGMNREYAKLVAGLPELGIIASHLQVGANASARRLDRLDVLACSKEIRRSVSAPIAGFVYIIGSPDGYCKIGRAKVLDSRLKQIALQLPFKVELIHSIAVADPIQAERVLHRRFADRRMNGEWFALTPEDIDWLKARSDVHELCVG
jgi:hypothetical protein